MFKHGGELGGRPILGVATRKGGAPKHRHVVQNIPRPQGVLHEMNIMAEPANDRAIVGVVEDLADGNDPAVGKKPGNPGRCCARNIVTRGREQSIGANQAARGEARTVFAANLDRGAVIGDAGEPLGSEQLNAGMLFTGREPCPQQVAAMNDRIGVLEAREKRIVQIDPCPLLGIDGIEEYHCFGNTALVETVSHKP